MINPDLIIRYGDLRAEVRDEYYDITDEATGDNVLLDRNEAIALRNWLNKVLP